MIRLMSFLLLLSSVALADDVAEGYFLYRARVEAKACSLQINIVKASIEKHFMGVEASKEICFDMGQLATYLKLLDLAVDDARDDLAKEDWETRYYFRLPFRERDSLLGACGIGTDPSMPVGDFEELLRRLEKLQPVLDRLSPVEERF